jgi:hypothetical protein
MKAPIKRTVTVDPTTGSKTKTLSYLGKNTKYVRDVTTSKDGKDKVVKSAMGMGNANGEFKAFKAKEKSSFDGKRVDKAVATTVRNKEGKVMGGKAVEKMGGVKTSLKDNPITGKSTYKATYPNKNYNKKIVMDAAGKTVRKKTSK